MKETIIYLESYAEGIESGGPESAEYWRQYLAGIRFALDALCSTAIDQAPPGASWWNPDLPEVLLVVPEEKLIIQPPIGGNVPVWLALAMLLFLPALTHAAEWKRPRWADANHDCRDTRAEVLASSCRLVTWDEKGCHVTAATCADPYSGAEVSTDSAPQALQVDHLFPAHEAYVRRTWRPGEFEAFFNYRLNLVATRSRYNAQKSDRMPDSWCPANKAARPDLAQRFFAMAFTFRLPLKPAERVGLQAWARGECASGAKIIGGKP